MQDYISIKRIIDNNIKCIEIIQYENGCLAVKKEGFSKESQCLLQHEYEIYKTIPDFDRIGPKIIDTDGISYFIEEYIEGLSLENVIEKRISDNHVESVANVFEDLHNKSVETLRRGHPEFDDWKKYLIKNVDSFACDISCIDDFAYVDMEPVIKYVYNSFIEMDYMDKSSVILHNDLNGGNIIFMPNGKVRFLDFERWVIGDPLKELSKMVWLFRKNRLNGWKFYNKFIERGLIKDDLERLKAYFFYDILFHLSLYNELKYDRRWKMYIEEEIDIIKRFEDFVLW